MSVVIYRLTQLHTATRGGANQSIDAEVRGVAKSNETFPYTTANEVVALHIGRALGLPIPAGVIAEDGSGRLFFLSLDVSKTGHTLPPVHPPDVVAQERFLSAGSVIFDFLIANEDRNTSNLSLDPAFTPPRLSLYDHGHALLGSGNPQGGARLNGLASSPGCLGPPTCTGTRQALLDHVSSASDVEAWIERIEQMSDYVVRDACAQLSDAVNVPSALATELGDWLCATKQGIRGLVESNHAEFRAVTTWTL
jgi:hypothetical protein